MDNVLDFMNTNSGAIQGIAIIVLVIVTIYYAIQAQRTVKETIRQREQNILPVIIPTGFKVSPKSCSDQGLKFFCVNCFLKNIGSGPAFNIRLAFYSEESKRLVGRSINIIDYLEIGDSNEKHIHLEEKGLKSIGYKERPNGELAAFVVVFINFNDFYGKELKVKRIFTFVKQKKGITIRPVIGTFKFR